MTFYPRTGNSTVQILKAPRNAFFVHANGGRPYYANMAFKCGRQDLRLLSVGDFFPERIAGTDWAVVIDHHAATLISTAQHELAQAQNQRARAFAPEECRPE